MATNIIHEPAVAAHVIDGCGAVEHRTLVTFDFNDYYRWDPTRNSGATAALAAWQAAGSGRVVALNPDYTPVNPLVYFNPGSLMRKYSSRSRRMPSSYPLVFTVVRTITTPGCTIVTTVLQRVSRGVTKLRPGTVGGRGTTNSGGSRCLAFEYLRKTRNSRYSNNA